MARTQPPRDTPKRPAGLTRLLAGAGLVALFGGMALVVMASGDDDGTAPPATTTTAAAPAPKPTPKPPAAVKIVVTGVGAYDPEGDGTENESQAGLATDGDPATSWRSERYRSTFTKSGVGLVLDAGRPIRASSLVVTTDTPGYDALVQVGDSAEGPFTPVSGSKTTASRTAFTLKARRGRYLVLWITSMPASGAAAVNEVAVAARG